MLVYYFALMKRWIHGVPAVLALVSLPASGQQRSYSAADIASGKQLFSVQCQPCHGPSGDLVAGVDMRKGQFKRASTDEEISRIIANGVPGTGMPPFSLPENSRTALVAYIRSLHETGSASAGAGDAQRGREIVEGKGGCLSCHRIAGQGAHKGPDLTDIGSQRNVQALQRALVDPNDTILPQERTVRAVTKSGNVIRGMRLNEDTHTVQLIDQNEHLVSLMKSDLREYTVEKTSPMPSYQGKLTAQEMGDVIAYLLSLKGLP